MNEFAKLIHEGNASRGFWENPNSIKKCALLALGELCEAVEGDRNNNWCTPADLESYIQGHSPFEGAIKDTVQDEFADVIIRIYDYAYYYKLNLDEPINTEEAKQYLVDDMCDAIFDIITSEFRKYYKTRPIKLISLVYALADRVGIYNLDFHIQAKLSYNSSRPYKHGKKY